MNLQPYGRHGLVVLAIVTLSACTARTALAPPPMPAVDPGDGLIVTLTWAAPVDLDLYVTDPTWETVYFGNNPNRAGGRLERDERCRNQEDTAPRVEVVRLPRPAVGPYRVGVDFIDACDSGIAQASFRVAVAIRGDQRERIATATMNVFAPIVLELGIGREDSGVVFTKDSLAQ